MVSFPIRDILDLKTRLFKRFAVLIGISIILIIVVWTKTRTSVEKAELHTVNRLWIISKTDEFSKLESSSSFSIISDTTSYQLSVVQKKQRVLSQLLCNKQLKDDSSSRVTISYIQKYLVIGAISQPGYVISSVLKGNRVEYRITEDISSLGFDLGTWTSYDRLKEIGITPEIHDYSNNKLVKSQMEWVKGGTLVYIPSLLFNAIHKDSPFDVDYTSYILNNFINILEIISKQSWYMTKVIFVIPEAEGVVTTVHRAAIKQFSLILSSYAQVYSNTIRPTFIQGTSSAGAVHCIDKADKLNNILESIFLADKGVFPVLCGFYSLHCTFSSNHSVPQPTNTQQPLRDVVSSTYYIGKGDEFKKDSFEFMRGFFMTAMNQKVSILLFYDNLSNGFRERVKNHYNKVEFVRTKDKDMMGRYFNDIRFYFLYEYLLNHPDVRSIVLQDLRDGIFTGNPFTVMDGIGDLIYVGMDKAFYLTPYEYHWMVHKIKKCHPRDHEKDSERYRPFYNAGTVGGTRDVMLTFLTRLIVYFNKAPHNHNCNMGTVSVVTHNHFFNYAFSGYPFQFGFEGRYKMAPPRGLAIRHKDTGYI